MRHQKFHAKTLGPLLVVAMLGCGVAGVAAQTARVGEPVFELTVVAPRLVRRQTARDSASGAPAELVSLTRRVSYSDLDLTRYADVRELDRRIETVAREACEQLAGVFPLSDSNTPDCVAEAVAGAKAQAERAIAAASR
jgi:UrcA family protein